MSAYTQLCDQILTVVRDADTSITIALREEQARRENWAKRLETGELQLPFVILSCARLSGVSVVPSGNGFTVPVQIHLVTGIGESADVTQDVLEQLITIWQKLLTSEMPQMSEEGSSMDASITSPILATILNVSAPLSGGTLSCQFIIDLTP